MGGFQLGNGTICWASLEDHSDRGHREGNRGNLVLCYEPLRGQRPQLAGAEVGKRKRQIRAVECRIDMNAERLALGTRVKEKMESKMARIWGLSD